MIRKILYPIFVLLFLASCLALFSNPFQLNNSLLDSLREVMPEFFAKLIAIPIFLVFLFITFASVVLFNIWGADELKRKTIIIRFAISAITLAFICVVGLFNNYSETQWHYFYILFFAYLASLGFTFEYLGIPSIIMFVACVSLIFGVPDDSYLWNIYNHAIIIFLCSNTIYLIFFSPIFKED